MQSFTARLAALSVFAGAMVIAAGGSSAVAQTLLDACDQPQMSVPVRAAPLPVSSESAPGARPKVKKARPIKVAAAKPDAAKPEVPKPEADKPEAAKPEGAKPEAAKPDPAKPEAGKPKVAKVQARRPVRQPRNDVPENGASTLVAQVPVAPAAVPSRACTVRSAALVPGLPTVLGGHQDLLKPADRPPLKLMGAPAPAPCSDIASFLPPGVSVETATVAELTAAMARYGAAPCDSVLAFVVTLVVANPDQAVKIAVAAQKAWPDRTMELALAIANVAPQAAVQIVAALAKVDPALAPALANMILPATGMNNQTSSSRGPTTVQQEMTVRTAPGNSSASPTGRS